MSALVQERDGLVSNLAWKVDALCAQVDSEIFFPERGESTKAAKKVCASCPVQAACLHHAIDNDETIGVWGGLSGRDLRAAVADGRVTPVVTALPAYSPAIGEHSGRVA